MGRYYTGDIEGKFWFGVQVSNDASFFGGEESEPSYLNYYFTSEDMPKILEGIQECEDKLGENRLKLQVFFAENNGYNDKQVQDLLGDGVGVQETLEWYARLELGQKIRRCVEKTGECRFEAEL